MIPEYVQRIKDWPVPKRGKEVNTFLGFAGYYRNFIPQCSSLTNRLMKKAKKFFWNEEIVRDFVMLKRAFTEGGIKAFPDFGVRRISWDSCPKSRTDRKDSLDVEEESVTSTRGIILVELLAEIQHIKKWKHILGYHLFEVHTDASTLKYLSTMKNQSRSLQDGTRS